MHPLGVEDHVGHGGGGLPAELDGRLRRPDGDQLHHVADNVVDVGRGQLRLAFLAEGEHVHDQGRDLVLVLLDDLPALADHGFVVVGKSQLDEVAAAADALEDILDVVGKRGDGLPDGGQPLGLDHGGIVAGVLDGQGRLVADGDHQLEVVFAELVDAPRWITCWAEVEVSM